MGVCFLSLVWEKRIFILVETRKVSWPVMRKPIVRKVYAIDFC